MWGKPGSEIVEAITEEMDPNYDPDEAQVRNTLVHGAGGQLVGVREGGQGGAAGGLGSCQS